MNKAFNPFLIQTNALKRILAFVLFLCVFLFWGHFNPSYAGSCTWNGGGADNNWSTAGNWGAGCTGTGGVPSASDSVTFDGTSTKNATIDSSFGGSVASLNINSGYTGTITQSRTLTIASGDYTQAAGTFTGGAFTMTITGNFNISNGTFTGPSGQNLSITGNFNQTGGSWSPGSNGKIQFNGSTNSTVTLTTNNFNQFTINKSVSTATVTFGDAFSVVGAFTITQGTLANPSSAITTSISGNFSQAANTTTGGTNLTLKFNPGSNRTLTQSAGSIASPIQFAPSAGKIVSLATNLSTTGASATCTVTSGIFALAGFNFTCGGTFEVQNGTTFQLFGNETSTTPTLDSGSTVTFIGQGDGLTHTYTVPNWSYSTITFNATDGTKDTFTAPAGTLTVGANFNNTAGTFAANSGTVQLTGSTASISGTTTFYNLTDSVTTASTLTFPQSVTQTIQHTLTLGGTAGNQLTLQSSTPGTQWKIDAQATATTSYINLSDSNNIDATPIAAGVLVYDYGDNTGWTGLASTTQATWIGGGSDNNWSTAANWSTNSVPTSTTNVVFDSTSTKNATIDTSFAGSVASISINSGYTGTITQAENLSVTAGNFSQAAGTFNGVTFSITITGSFSLTGGTFTSPTNQNLSVTNNFTVSGGTFGISGAKEQFNGSPNTVINTNQNLGIVTINKTGTVPAVYIASTFQTSNFTLTQGTLANATSSATLTVNGNFVQNANTTIGGNNLTIKILSSSTKTVTQTAGSIASPLLISPTAGNSVVLGSNFVTSGGSATCEVTAGTFYLAGFNFTCGSTFSVDSGATFKLQGGETATTPTLNSGSTTLFVGPGDSATHTYNLPNWTYGTLTLNATDGTKDTFTAPVGMLTVAGNFNDTAGTFANNSGTVSLTGSTASISGATTFYNLTDTQSGTSTLTFPQSVKQIVQNILTLQGSSGGNLSLQSSHTGTQWLIDAQGTNTISYLTVQDSDNVDINPIDAINTNSTDNGNNTGWTFPIGSSFTQEMVYGQPDFTHNNIQATSASSLNNPYGLTVDNNDNVWIADTVNNRVLYYPVGTTSASRVFGQSTFLTISISPVNASSLYAPRDVAVDSTGGVYIADSSNNRVLYFPANQTTATRVYGQLDFTHHAANQGGAISSTTLNNPYSVALDNSGGLYIADTGNNRVLYYPSGTTTATAVFGQPDFISGTANNGGISATAMNSPTGVDVDSNGNLYVADELNNRVLYFPAGGTTATLVYGQPNFTSNTINNGGISANSLYRPSNIAFDPADGDIYVTDQYNNRVLHYPAGTAQPDIVYGQNDFTHNNVNNGGLGASSLYRPIGVAVDTSGNLFVSDQFNNRALFIIPTAVTPTPTPGSQAPGSSSSNTMSSLETTVLTNMQQDGIETLPNVNNGLGGLWINWQATASATTSNWTETPYNECTATPSDSCTNNPPREDPLTDIRYLHNLYSYKNQTGSTSFDSQITTWNQITKTEYTNTRNQRGWIYDELIDLYRLSGDSWYANTADQLVNYYVNNYYNTTCNCLVEKVNSTYPTGWYRPGDMLTAATAMIQEGERVGNQTWITDGYNSFNFIYNHAFLSSYDIFPEQMTGIFTDSTLSTVNSNETFEYQYGSPTDRKRGTDIQMGEISQEAQMMVHAYQLTGDTLFKTVGEKMLDAETSSTNTLGLWDSTNGGYYFGITFSGSTINNPGTPTINTGEKEIGRQLIMLQTFHEADQAFGDSSRYASMETSLENLATDQMYYAPQSGYLYRMSPTFGLMTDKGNPENWVTSEADGAVLEAFFSETNSTPTPSNISVNPANTSATVSFNSAANASAIIDYNLINNYSTNASTSEQDTSPRVKSHSVTVTSLLPCVLYHYRTRSNSAEFYQNVTSSDNTFITTGCTGSASVLSKTSSQVASTSGGTVPLLNNDSSGVTLTIPAAFANQDANFQIEKLDPTTVVNNVSSPTGYANVGSYVYEMQALASINTKITSFTNPVNITISYNASDVSGEDPTKLTIERYDSGTGWTQLSNCSVNTSAQTVTCSTSGFSTFMLVIPSSNISNNSGGGSSSGGSSSSSSSSNNGPKTCTEIPPSNSPDLYQIDTTNHSAKLYFAPSNMPYSSYTIGYGKTHGEDIYAVNFPVRNSNGAITYTINYLSPNTTYYFHVEALNDCSPSSWSNTIGVNTTTYGSAIYYKSFFSIVNNTFQVNTNGKTVASIPLPFKVPSSMSKPSHIPQAKITLPNANPHHLNNGGNWFTNIFSPMSSLFHF